MRTVEPVSTPAEATIRELFARARAAAPPELDQGTLGIQSPGGTTVGNVYTISLGSNQFTEHWVIYDGAFLNGGDCTFVSVSTAAPNWAAVLANLKTMPNWQNFWYAKLDVTRQTPPTQAQIDAMPDMPAGHERRVFDLKNGASVTGGWYQDIYPSGSLNRMEHWRCGSSYQEPTTGVSVGVVRKAPPDPTVKQFLTTWVNAGGYYVAVSYTWGRLP